MFRETARLWGFVLPLVGLALAAAGCGKSGTPFFVGNERPIVELSAAPQPLDSVFYSVRLQWFSFDTDGRVTHHIYAVDPPASGDTTWVRIERNEITIFFESSRPRNPLPQSGPVASSDFHVFVIKAVDNEGQPSAPVFRAFTSWTVAPQSQILTPSPSRLLDAITAPSLLITWTGNDPDAVLADKPVKYKFKLVSIQTIQQALGLGTGIPTQANLQTFFEQEAPTFASWDSVPPDSAFKQFEGLTPGQKWYFAVVSFDEAGAYEPRFLLDNNVLQFRPSTSLQAPRIAIFNSFFFRQQASGGFSLSESQVVDLEVPADEPIFFSWFAEPGAPGTQITGFRWVLDPPDGDVFDETPRESEDDINRWSDWSISVLSTTLPAFQAEPGEEVFKRFYVQARDNVGSVSMMVVEIRVVEPTFEKPLLVFDDWRAPPDRALFPPGDPRNNQPFGSFPTEAVADTLFYAIGDVPYRARPSGTTSLPGVFAGFDYDTLDYRFFPFEGLPLRFISQYQAVVWYVENLDAARDGEKFSTVPRSAIRLANSRGHLNTLAVYLSQGGKAWIFGDGLLPSIGNGYVERFGQTIARFPFTGTGDGPTPNSILWPGNFMYDFMKIRSEMDLNTRLPFSSRRQVVSAVPYLPQFRTPGAPWPPDGWTGGRGAMDDPRVGPSSTRNLARWDGLPMLTLTTEFSDWPSPLPTALPNIPYISLPLFILENQAPPGKPPVNEARLDTLYLLQARNYVLSRASFEPDGKPVFFYYWGDDHGPLAWTGLPLWYFERTQLQKVAELILRQFGLEKNPNPRSWTGPSSAHRKIPRVVEVSTRE